MRIITLTTLIALLLFSACQSDEEMVNISELDDNLEAALREASPNQSLSYFEFPASEDFNSIPQDPKNPLSQEKVALGKLLYHETALAINPMQEIGIGKYSCASCHFASAGFQAGRFQGISEGGVGFGINGEGREKGALYSGQIIDCQPIRTPSAMNGAFQIVQLWNGQFGATGLNEGTEANWTAETPKEVNNLGYEGLETQAIAGLKVHRLGIDMNILGPLGYKELFDTAFPNVPENERYTNEFAGLAIAAYERTLLANEAPFQKWIKGNKNALSEQEKLGAILFFSEAECSTCHTGPALNSMEFHALGMTDLYECGEVVFQSSFGSEANLGRGGFTGVVEDMYKFKVPQLYNLEDSPFYGHGSSFKSIREVIDYKNEAISQSTNVPASQLASGFHSLNLDSNEVDAITAFVERGLKDPNLDRYVPESILSGNCFPFNDPLAASQLGCE